MSKTVNIRTNSSVHLPENWMSSTLGEISEKPQYGWTTKANPEVGELKLLRTTDITSGTIEWSTVPYCTEEPEDVEKYLVKSGDILISRAGSVGVSFLINNPERAVFASYLIRFRAMEGVDPKYFYYYLKSPNYWAAIGASKSGIAVPNVNASKLSLVPIPIAPPNEQKLIVAEIEKQFSRLDEAVANLKHVKANLKRYKAAVLKAAVEGKLTEEWRKQHPNIEPASKLLERILAERRAKWPGKGTYKEPNILDTTDLPPMASSWKWVSLDQLFLNITDGDHQPPPQTDSGVPFLVIGNVRSGKLDFKDTRFVSREYADAVDVFRKPTHGDILYTLVGSFGMALRVDTDREFCIQRHIGVLRPHKLSPTSYLVHVLNSSLVLNQATNVATGTAQKTVPLAGLRRFAIPLAPLAEQQQTVAEVERRLSVIAKLDDLVEASLKRSEHIRRSTLVRAFEGKLVPAIPSDEPANVLLDRLRTRKEKASETLQIGLTEVAMVKRRVVVKDKQPIIHVLKHANRWLSTAELLAKAGYSKDAAPDEMEAFYLELKKELKAEPRSIEVERRNDFDHFRAV